MSKNKRPRKQYRPGRCAAATPLRAQPWKLHAAFAPLDDMLEQIEQTGMLTAARNGMPIFQPPGDSDWVEIPSAIEGFIDAFQLHAHRAGITIDTNPLKQLANKLRYDMPLAQSDITAARACSATLRQIASGFQSGYAQDLVRSVQIKHEFEAMQA